VIVSVEELPAFVFYSKSANRDSGGGHRRLLQVGDFFAGVVDTVTSAASDLLDVVKNAVGLGSDNKSDSNTSSSDASKVNEETPAAKAPTDVPASPEPEAPPPQPVPAQSDPVDEDQAQDGTTPPSNKPPEVLNPEVPDHTDYPVAPEHNSTQIEAAGQQTITNASVLPAEHTAEEQAAYVTVSIPLRGACLHTSPFVCAA
jgi:hypothetical protein